MAIIHFRLTDERPQVLFGGSSLLFSKLVIRIGEIDDLQFELSWMEHDPLNKHSGVKVSHNLLFSPMGFIDTTLPPSETVYEFRKTNLPPVFDLSGNVGGILLCAFSESGKPFDVDIHVVINHFSRFPD